MEVLWIEEQRIQLLLRIVLYAFAFLTPNLITDIYPQLTCLGTLIPEYCDSLTDTTCICTNTELAAVLLPCAVAACNVTDSLQLARYQAEVCETPNDKTRYWQQIHTYIVLVPVTTIFVGLRIFARLRLNIGLGPYVHTLTIISFSKAKY